jgi:energy-converting hydrogenase A subunit M
MLPTTKINPILRRLRNDWRSVVVSNFVRHVDQDVEEIIDVSQQEGGMSGLVGRHRINSFRIQKEKINEHVPCGV